MKTLISAVSCLLLALTVGAAEIKFGDTIAVAKPDKRLVGTTTVDVGPVHAWLQSNQGDRPLKHWKQLQVFSVKGYISTMAQCVIKAEDGRFEEILLKNLPPQVPDFLAAFASEAAAITNLQTEIAVHLAEVHSADTVTITEATYLDQYLEDVLTAKARADLAKAAVQEKSEALQKLLNNHEAMRARASEATSVLAMNTMRKFAGMPVWDCGMQK
jgi:hypothetical protein